MSLCVWYARRGEVDLSYGMPALTPETSRNDGRFLKLFRKHCFEPYEIDPTFLFPQKRRPFLGVAYRLRTPRRNLTKEYALY